jgi:hypothetical protein
LDLLYLCDNVHTSLKMTPDDEMSVEKCIGVLLGSKSLELVRFLTSTQKCEAFNRTLQQCNPKNVTHSRNFPGRAHTATHLRNHWFGNSTLLRTKVLDATIFTIMSKGDNPHSKKKPLCVYFNT